MSQFTGYKCDVCGETADSRVGWMKLDVHPAPQQRPDPGIPDICSNRCLANLAIERLREVDGEELSDVTDTPKKRTRRLYSDDEKELFRMRYKELGETPEALRQAAEELGAPPTTTMRWIPDYGQRRG